MPAVPTKPLCRTCTYDLHGLRAGQCPECSTPFDPADPSTLARPAGPSRYLVRYGATGVFLFTILICLWIVADSTRALGLGFFPTAGKVFLLLIAAVVWFGLAMGHLWPRSTMPARSRVTGRLLLGVPLAWLATLVLVGTGLPHLARWKLEEPGMTRLAQAILTTTAPPGGQTPPRFAFSYRCDAVNVTPYGVRFELDEYVDRGFMDFGFAIVYAPAAAPALKFPLVVEHIRGPWYLVYEVD